MKTYHVGVDVTRSVWVYVDAENEQEAEKLAKVQAELDSTDGAGAYVSSEVHYIEEEV